MARKRMMQEVPKADVVITNPTHYAVALRYDEQRMRAPIVVAKGVDLIAPRIREIAVEHKVPLVEAPPLARALHAQLRAGRRNSGAAVCGGRQGPDLRLSAAHRAPRAGRRRCRRSIEVPEE